MSLEDLNTDRKSLRTVTGRTADWDAVARASVCFANGSGGRLLIGIEDGETLPPQGQVIAEDLPDRLRRRVGELTVNVQAGVVEMEGRKRGARYRLLDDS